MRITKKICLGISVVSILVLSGCLNFELPSASDEDIFKNTTFEDQTFVYDGNVHSLEARDYSGATVTYENNVQTEVGVYEVKASFSVDGVVEKEMIADLTIVAADTTPDPEPNPGPTYPDGYDELAQYPYDKVEVEVDRTTTQTYTTTQLVTKMKSLKAGETLVIPNGTYDFSGTTIQLKNDGTNDKPIRIIAEETGEVFFTGKVSIEIDGDYNEFIGVTFKNGYANTLDDYVSGGKIDNQDAGYVFQVKGENNRISSVEIDNFDNGLDYKTTYINLKSSAYNTEVDNCSFINKNSLGVMLLIEKSKDSTGILYSHVHNNYFYNFADPTTFKDYNECDAKKDGVEKFDNGFEAIRIGDSGSSQYMANCIIEDNIFEEISAEPEIISIKTSNNIIRRNLILNCEAAITLRHGSHNVVDSNIILNDEISSSSNKGIRAFDTDHMIINNYISGIGKNDDFYGAIVLHNGTYSLTGDSSVLSGAWLSKDVVIANNTIVNSVNSIAIGDNKYVSRPTGVQLSNNFVYTSESVMVRVINDGSNDSSKATATFSNEWYYSTKSSSSFVTSSMDKYYTFTNTNQVNLIPSVSTNSNVTTTNTEASYNGSKYITYSHSNQNGATVGATGLNFITTSDVGPKDVYYTSRDITNASFNEMFNVYATTYNKTLLK